MLRSMTWEQFLEWRTFDNLEPFGEERDDYRFASIVQTLWNIARDTKRYPDGFPLSDFVLLFGDTPATQRRAPQTLEYQEMLIEAWCTTNNAVLDARGAQ